MEGADKEISRTFGNYILHGIEEVHLPDPITWMPQTIGWKVLGLVAVFVLGVMAFRVLRKWWGNRYRREALKQLTVLESSASDWKEVARTLPELLKATALQAYSRNEIASLSGRQWLAFLDDHCTGSSFLEKTGQQLIELSYLPDNRWSLTESNIQALIKDVRYWISNHHVSIKYGES